jgi:hypothetical protein
MRSGDNSSLVMKSVNTSSHLETLYCNRDDPSNNSRLEKSDLPSSLPKKIKNRGKFKGPDTIIISP